MLPDSSYPIFSLDSPPDLAGTTRLLPLLLEESKHIALFFIGDLTLHEFHAIFAKFIQFYTPYLTNLRPVVLSRTYRLGGFRKPNWTPDNDILFLATNSSAVERRYGFNGKEEMGVFIIRPDGYIGISTIIQESGAE